MIGTRLISPLRFGKDPLMASQHVKEFKIEHSTVTFSAQAHERGHGASLASLVFGALGVVFGDIGTSPLYTLKECLHAAGGAKATVADLYGILSLMLWA